MGGKMRISSWKLSLRAISLQISDSAAFYLPRLDAQFVVFFVSPASDFFSPTLEIDSFLCSLARFPTPL